MANDQYPERRQGMSWMVRTVFGVSLALNLAVLGLVAGVWLSGGPGGFGPGGDRAERGRSGPLAAVLVRAMDRQEQKSLREELRAALKSAGASRRPAQAEFDAIKAVIAAEPFDPDAFEQLLLSGSRRAAQGHEIGRRLLTSRIAAMSAEERSAYADRVEEELKKPRRKRRPRP